VLTLNLGVVSVKPGRFSLLRRAIDVYLVRKRVCPRAGMDDLKKAKILIITYSVLLRGVRWFKTDVSDGLAIGSIFKGEDVQEEGHFDP
jgi:hypothetical protein